MKLWLNGQFVDRDKAMLPVFDAAFQHGVGLFETMLARNGRTFRIAHHLRRLADSAAQLRLIDQLRIGPLAQAVQSVLDRNEMLEGRIRLTITGGNLNLLQSQGKSTIDPTVLIVPQPPTPYPDTFFTEGVMVTIADGRLNPLDSHAAHKTLHYWPRLRALQTAGSRGGGESLWFSISNHLAGGSVSNIFLVKDAGLVTPFARGEESAESLPSPVLPGITRGTIIELAASEKITVEKRMLDIDDLLEAEEVFLTNSSWGVLPVVRVEKEEIGSGQPGPITHQLRQAWLDCVQRETAEVDSAEESDDLTAFE